MLTNNIQNFNRYKITLFLQRKSASRLRSQRSRYQLSNRPIQLLEAPLTHSKQRTAHRSNRPKITFSSFEAPLVTPSNSVFPAMDKRGQAVVSTWSQPFSGVSLLREVNMYGAARSSVSRRVLSNLSRSSLAAAVASLLFFTPFFAPVANAGGNGSRASSRQDREPLGSLTTVGTVYVNGAPAPAEVTVFAGDTVLTSDTASATFTMSGKGSFKLSPQTHLAFVADARYLAELTTGTVVMTSFAGSTDVTLKMGGYVIAPVIQTEESSSRIDGTANGGFVVSCLTGSVGVVPVEGANGQVLRVGQTLAISPSGQLGTPQEASTPVATNTPVKKSTNSHTTYIILGVAGAGAAGAAIALAGHGHSSSVSPATVSAIDR
jgi:hypothetical protein